jgi:hypothetical protein
MSAQGKIQLPIAGLSSMRKSESERESERESGRERDFPKWPLSAGLSAMC